MVVRETGERVHSVALTIVEQLPGTDDALALQDTADCPQLVLCRYNGATTRGRHVMVIDMVNEPTADGTNTVDRMQDWRPRHLQHLLPVRGGATR